MDEWEEILGSSEGPFVTIHVLDTGSATGNVALQNELTSAALYGAVKSKIASALKEAGMKADVQVVSTSPGGPMKTGVGLGVLIGAGLVALFNHLRR